MHRLLILVLCCLAQHSFGHEIRPAFLAVEERATVGESRQFAATFRQPQINGRYLGLSLLTNCEQELLTSTLDSGSLSESHSLVCNDQSLTDIRIGNLDRTLIDTLVSISWLDGTVSNHLISGQQPHLSLSGAARNLPVYLAIGFEHLIYGFDHVLFLLMLLYLVQSPVALVKVITAFTLAHSLTLALSALDILRLSQAPVEAVIAASIMLLAYENLRQHPHSSRNFPVLIAFGFGLLHGLGFAGALAEIGLPAGSRLEALLLFNLGIEAGQLAIVALVMLPVTVLRIRPGRFLRELPLYATGGIACLWFLQRSWQIMVPALGLV